MRLITYTCTVADSESTAALFCDLLLEFSKEHTVFFMAHQLPNECVTKIFDPSIILEQAESLCHPIRTFLHLGEARPDEFYNSFKKGCSQW
ncbi:MAG: hypothetical protein NC417_08435 [Candidatus Gastranaerophilales bacterium]|nr:hypothetical protein [Candidatus Gastranaerophilales bacterium]